MAITTVSNNESVRSRTIPVTALNLYIERIKAVTDSLRSQTSGYAYTPFQLGGLIGQQQALDTNVVVSVVDFKVSGNT